MSTPIRQENDRQRSSLIHHALNTLWETKKSDKQKAYVRGVEEGVDTLFMKLAQMPMDKPISAWPSLLMPSEDLLHEVEVDKVKSYLVEPAPAAA